MCNHYESVKTQSRLAQFFGVNHVPAGIKADMWPRYRGVFVRRPPEHDAGDDAVPARESVEGRWGLIPASVRAAGLEKAEKLSTVNARSETASTAYTFQGAWKRSQRCIIPAEAFYEPDWRTGRAVATRFERADGRPMGIAGLWDHHVAASGDLVASYTMLTINADEHPLLRHYHRPGKEKRMIVVLPDNAFDEWLCCSPTDAYGLLTPYPAGSLTTSVTGVSAREG